MFIVNTMPLITITADILKKKLKIPPMTMLMITPAAIHPKPMQTMTMATTTIRQEGMISSLPSKNIAEAEMPLTTSPIWKIISK